MKLEQQQVLDKLYKKLPDYLESQGIDPSDKFSCVSKTHDDKNPSCSILPHNKHLAHCFSCARSFNIFHAANELEGLPYRGMDFWKITIPEMCKRFGLDYKAEELTEADKTRLKMLAAYKTAADIICQYPENGEEYDTPIYEYLQERGWKVQTAKDLGIGAVPNYDEYMAQMARNGWDIHYLRSAGLADTQLFTRESLIFVVRDENGRPRGFAARDMKWVEGKGVKYRNTKANEIYHKSELLYCFDNGKKNTTEAQPIWIVEGYGDVPTLWEHGIRNVAGVGGTAFTDAHIELLARNDLYRINFMFDNDNYEGKKRGGQEALAEIIDKHFKGSAIFHVKIKELPDNTDPDEFLKSEGLEAFEQLPLLTPFEWSLRRIPYNVDTYELAKNKALEIALDSSAINRDRMIEILSSVVDVPKNVIKEDVEREIKKHDQVIDQEKKKWAEHAEYRLREVFRYNREPSEVLDEIMTNWKDVQKKYSNPEDGAKQYESKLKKIRQKFMTDSPPPFNMGSFRTFSKYTEEIRRSGAFIGLAAIPNIGKSSWLRNMMWEIMKNNSDAIGIYFSLDDPFARVVSAFLSMESELPINTIRDASRKIFGGGENNGKGHLVKQWAKAWERFEEVKERLIVKDITDGYNIPFLEKTITYYKNKFPGKDMIVMIDSFNKLRDYMDKEKETRATLISNKLKELATTYDIPIITVLELRKTQSFNSRPTIMDIKNTRSIEYDADVIFLMHQELHLDPETHWKWWAETGLGRIAMPICEVHVAKNKEGEFKGKLYMKFRSDQSRFEEISQIEVNKMVEQEKEKKKE